MPTIKWFVIFALLYSLAAFRLDAQVGAAAPRIAQPVNDSKLVVLSGTLHPLARLQYDRGVAPASLPMDHMLLVLKRSPQQQAALDSLLAEQQDRNSPNYHKWLTPAQFGAEFGASDQDIQTITSWLKSQGFTVNSVSSGRTVIDFSGTAATVQGAFHTAIHRYVLPDGTQHWANSTNIEIPAALTPVVAGVRSLDNFFPQPLHHAAVRPAFTYNYGAPCVSATNNTCYDVTPGDFDTIYNVPATATGAGETIAIVSDSDVSATDLAQFRSLFGLPAMAASGPTGAPGACSSGPCFVQFVPPNQTDPGIQSSGNESEAILDAEWAGATAPEASVWLVSSADTMTTFGGDLSATYVVNCDSLNLNYASDCPNPNPVSVPAHVLSDSYGQCESTLGATNNMFYSNLWSQAATEGITVVVASGDSGSADCDAYVGNTPEPATQGLAVNGVASTPYDVAVGGTDFDQSSDPSQFWSATNAGMGASALGYIPETAWNDSCTNAAFGNDPIGDCNSANNSGYVFTLAGGGGPSTCATFSGSNCSAGYPKPCWQMATLTAPCTKPGTATPSDGVRDIPDISFFASNGFSGSAYIVCEADTPLGTPPGQGGEACSLSQPPASSASQASFEEDGGTSVAAQAFAGIAALIDQQLGGGGQGNIDQYLYNIAGTAGNTCASAASPAANCVFYDVTSGTISQPCAYGTSPSPNCVGTGTETYGVLESGGNLAYNAGAGYDYATGLGSINVANLFCNAAGLTCTTTTLQTSAATAAAGQQLTFTATVAPQTGNGTPTGTVNFLDGSTTLNSTPVALVAGVATFQTSSLALGTHFIKAAYPGDGVTFEASTSAPLQVQIKTATTTALQASASTVNSGQQVTFTATVTGSGGTPTGTVNFLDGGTQIGSGTLNGSGVATFSTTSLAVGAHSITAAYLGDSNFAASTSSAVNVQVNAAPDFTVSATPSSQSVTPGQSTSYTLTLTPQNGFNAAVTISCSGEPTESTCMPASSSVTLSGTTAQQVTINVTTTAASLVPPATPPFSGWRAPALLASLVLLCLLIAERFNRNSIAVRRWLAGAACATAIAFVLVGCGGGNKSTSPPSNNGTPAGTSTLTITGTSGSTMHTTTVSLVVQ